MDQREMPGGSPSGELPSMLSTLGTYERMFGPYNLQTLALAVQIAPVLSAAGDRRNARLFLEKAAKGLSRFQDGTLPVRLRALELLRDALIEDGELEPAVAVQREILACRSRSCAADDPCVLTERTYLSRLLLSAAQPAEVV